MQSLSHLFKINDKSIEVISLTGSKLLKHHRVVTNCTAAREKLKYTAE